MKTILVVEDDDRIREYLYELLRNSYHVVLATDGLEGWQVLTRGIQPDLVITDHDMPHLNVAELIKKIKDETAYTMPIILYTGHDPNELDVDFNTVTYLSKSADPYEIESVVERVIS